MDISNNPIIRNANEIIQNIHDESSDLHQTRISIEYLEEIDRKLIDLGWGFEGAKTVEFGNMDQSLLNHVRNGVYFLMHLNQVSNEFDERVLSDGELRDVVAMFVAHDLHKTLIKEEYDPEKEFDIPRGEIEQFAEETNLIQFGNSVTIGDLWSCTCSHHDSWNAKSGIETNSFKKLKHYVKLADSFASSPTPEDAVNERSIKAFDDVFYENLDLGYHSLEESTGVLTNLINAAVADYLTTFGYKVVAIYQDGCVYVKPSSATFSIDKKFVENIYQTFTEKVRNSHRSYSNAVELAENIDTVYNLGYYSPSDEDFFYAGPENVVLALAYKAAIDGNVDNDPTDSMVESIREAGEVLGVELEETRQLVGVARLVGGVKKTIVSELDVDDEILTTADLFGSSNEFKNTLMNINSESHDNLTAGGKFDYSYGIAQELLDTTVNGIPAKELSSSDFGDAVGDLLVTNLSQIDGWETIEETYVGDIRDELTSYISDILIVEGQSPTFDTSIEDAFEQYTAKRGGKICWLTNRTTRGMNKKEMEAKKSLTTLQAGFSNHTRVGASEPEKLLISVPMRIEFSLRETGSERREPDRLFFHFVPDYFFTPLSWHLTHALINQYNGDSSVRIGKLADSIFKSTYGEKEYNGVLDNLAFNEDGGRNMIESMMQGFEDGFGSFEIAYYKQKDNQTEFEFFGIFIALAIAGFTGLRVYVSSNPVPDLRARDFDEMARIGAGLSQTSHFYGDSVPLSELQETLRKGSALISLGYASQGDNRKDSLFPKYLRSTRNKLLPGSYLLKRIAQDDPDEGSRRAWSLMDEARHLDKTTGVNT